MEPSTTILAIEDDLGDVELLRRYLGDRPDLKLEFADRLSTGLKLISESRIDLVLLDLGLPDSQGIETLTRLHSQVPDIPVVVLTGLTEEALGVAAVRMGAQDYLVKGHTNRTNLGRSIHYGIERHVTQKALRKSQALLREAQRVAHIGHWELDSPMGTPTWSEEIFHIFGLDPAQGEPSFPALRNIIHPEDWELLHGSVTRACEYGTRFDIQFRVIRPDESIRWMKAKGDPTGNTESGTFRLFGIAQDITEGKKAEEALHKLNRELRAISTCNQTLLRAVDEQTLLNEICRIICDEAGYRLAWAGYAENDDAKTIRPVAWAGLDSGYIADAKLSWADDTERGQGPAGKAVRSGETICVQDMATDPRMAPWRESALQHGYRSGIAVPLKDENTKVFGVLLIYHSEPNAMTPKEIQLMEDLAGDLAFGIGVLRSRIERQQVEKALRENEERLSLALEVSNAGTWEWIVESDEVCLDARFHEMLGYTPGELPNTIQEWLPYHHAGDMPIWMSKAQAYLQGDSPIYESEHRIRTKAGTWNWVFTRGKLVDFTTTGSPKQFIGIAIDITERKQTENIMSARFRLVEYSVLHSLDELLQATLDEVEVLTDSSIGFCHFLEADEKTLRLQTWSTRTLREMCTAEGKGHRYDIDEAGVWVDCIHERRPVIHNDYSALPHRKGMPGGHAEVIRELVVPVFRGNRIVAIFGVGNKPVDYDASDIETVSLLADLAWDIAERKRAEEDIRASISRLKEAQRVARIGSWELNVVTNQLSWSDEVYHMFEIEPTEFGGSYEAFLDLIHPEDRETVNRAYTDSLANKTPYEIIHRLQFPDARIKYVHERWEHSCDAEEVPLRSVGTVQDITELTQVQLRLEDERAHLRTLVQTIPDLVWLKDPNGIYLTCNPRFERFFGAKQSDIVGKTDYDFVDAHLADFFREHDRKAMAAGKSSINEEWVTFADDGHSELLETIKTPMYDNDGSLIGVLGIARNITATRKAEEAQKLLATAIEQAAETVVITDMEGTIQYINPAFEKITGYTRQEAIGQNPRILKSAVHDAEFYEQLWDTLRAGRAWSGKFTNKKKDGTLYHEDATISPVKDASGKITNFVAVKRDITEHLQLSEQLQQAQKMEAVGTLAGGIAHDFNNILQVVLGYSELVLGDEDLPDRLRNDLGRVLLAGKNGADLVQRLLTFSRKTETRPLHLDLNQRIRQTQKFLERTIPKMIDIQVILADGLARIYVDPTQVDQMLMNLAVNARDAMSEGGKLVIETANVFLDEACDKPLLGAKPGEYVLLSVSDTGHGMDKETLEHIFEPFFTTKEAEKGTGLGLAMVYGIVKQHGGYITCYSEPGEGTTFKMYFPVIEMEIDREVTATGIMPAFGTETILLVDDEEFVRDLGKRILERSGYTVLTAADGKEALNLYKKERGNISLVILDLIMPEMGGKQCLDELLKIDPKARVLIASGYALDRQTNDALETGARGFVGKPYNMKEMLQSVREVLDSD